MNSVSTSTESLSHVYTPISYREGTKTIIEHNYELPKGQHSNLVGSWSYRPQSTKAGQLRATLQAKKRRLHDLQIRETAMRGLQPKKRRRLQCEIRYLENELAREMARIPEIRVNVRERENDE